MGHPMHLHGHKFWVLGTGSGDFPHETAHAAPASLLDFENPPYRDTVELPASGWAVIRSVLTLSRAAAEMLVRGGQLIR